MVEDQKSSSTIGCKGNHLRQRFMVSFQTIAFWLLFVVLAFLVGKQLKVAQESLQKLKEFDIRMNHISIAAAVIYITTQLSDEKKPLRETLTKILTFTFAGSNL
ncbi:hypothetical protein YC2023_066581 [Brassica napus]